MAQQAFKKSAQWQKVDHLFLRTTQLMLIRTDLANKQQRELILKWQVPVQQTTQRFSAFCSNSGGNNYRLFYGFFLHARDHNHLSIFVVHPAYSPSQYLSFL